MTTKCKKHPDYKAIRTPRADCGICRALRRMKLEAEIDKMQNELRRLRSQDAPYHPTA